MNVNSSIVALKKRLFCSVCLFIIIVCGVAFTVRRAAVPAGELNIQVKTTERRKLKANITNSTSLKEHLQSLIAIQEVVNARLMKPNDLAKNQQYFYRLETESGVKLSELRPTMAQQRATPNTPKTTYTTVGYSCTVQGSYQSLLKFLSKLENGEHFPRISTASVSLAGSGVEAASTVDPVLTLTLAIEFLGKS